MRDKNLSVINFENWGRHNSAGTIPEWLDSHLIMDGFSEKPVARKQFIHLAKELLERRVKVSKLRPFLERRLLPQTLAGFGVQSTGNNYTIVDKDTFNFWVNDLASSTPCQFLTGVSVEIILLILWRNGYYKRAMSILDHLIEYKTGDLNSSGSFDITSILSSWFATFKNLGELKPYLCYINYNSFTSYAPLMYQYGGDLTLQEKVQLLRRVPFQNMVGLIARTRDWELLGAWMLFIRNGGHKSYFAYRVWQETQFVYAYSYVPCDTLLEVVACVDKKSYQRFLQEAKAGATYDPRSFNVKEAPSVYVTEYDLGNCRV